jgi:hypothetical protein
VRAEWEPDELIEAWTLVKSDWDLIANKAGVTRLGFAVMLKFYEIGGRFPAYREEVPQAAVDYLGSLVKVEPALFAKYSWRGRTASTTGRRSAGRTGPGRRRRPMRTAGRLGPAAARALGNVLMTGHLHCARREPGRRGSCPGSPAVRRRFGWMVCCGSPFPDGPGSARCCCL